MLKRMMNTPKKKTAVFFALYAGLMAWLILMAVNFTTVKEQKTDFAGEFAEQVKVQEAKREEEKKREDMPLWEVSDRTAIIAVTAGAIADILVVLWWARRENRRMDEKQDVPAKKRWRDSKWFWYIAAMGVIQPSGSRYIINWKNMIASAVLIHVLLYLLIKNA